MGSISLNENLTMTTSVTVTIPIPQLDDLATQEANDIAAVKQLISSMSSAQAATNTALQNAVDNLTTTVNQAIAAIS